MILNSDSSSNKPVTGDGLQVTSKKLKNKYLSSVTRYLLLSMAIILIWVHPAMSAAPVIEKIEVDGLYSIARGELLYLLDLKAGDEVDPLNIRNGIRRAFLKGIFEDIEVWSEEGGIIRIKVKERDIIKSVNVSGNTDLSERAIRGLFSQKKGEVMRHDLMEDSLKLLRQALSERGFGHADVSAQVEKTDEPYRVNIIIRLNEGQPAIIDRISIFGPESEVRPLLRIEKGDIYNQLEVRAELERVKRHYKELGYINPSAGPYTFSDGELDIKVEPGRRLSVLFQGNTAVSAKDLSKEMPFFGAEDFRGDLIEEAIAKIKSAYHSKGYPFVQIAPVTNVEGDSINLHFFIHEGEKVAVGSVKFSGVTLDEDTLRSVMSLREGGIYNPELLYAEGEILREFYYALGYLNVDVKEPESRIEDHQAHIAIKINEGIRTLIQSIEINGAKFIPEEDIRKAITIRAGEPYNEVDISDARYRIVEMYIEHGFVNAKVDIKRELYDGRAGIIFDIHEGSPVVFGKTIIIGNKTTDRRVIERELNHRQGEAMNYGFLTKGRQKLYKLGLFTDVNIEPIEQYGSQRDVLVDLKEGNAGAVEFGVGYGDYEKYRVFLDISYRNLFGLNRQASFRAELSSLEERFLINYYEPWFLDRPLPFRVQFLREERTEKNIDTGEVSYRLKRYTFTAGVEKKLGRYFKGELYYEFSIVNTFDVQPDVILTKEDTGTLAISAIIPGIIYDTRDNPFEPRNGILAGVTLRGASSVIFSETDFVKAMFNGSFYKELSKRFVGAVSVRGGIAHSFGSTTELPLVERFFLGGRSTVRGYEQDTLGPKGSDGTPTGGNAFLATNIELRTYLGKDIGLVAFLDGGNVWVNINDINLSFKYTAGIGLRYSTPVGPLRVDYGYKLNREPGESYGEIHFSIGHAF